MTAPDFSSAVWRKSTHSGGQTGQCVEIAPFPGLIGVRDSKNPDGPFLTLAPGAFHSLVQHLHAIG